MFRHKGQHRTYTHNLKLASLLSFVAGLVNVSGYFSINTLTTNVTGHFTLFAQDIVKNNYHSALFFLLYTLSFFAGAFFSSIAVEFTLRKKERYMYTVPVLIEMLILTTVSLYAVSMNKIHIYTMASLLLFAMGMQNALVTSISNAVVRTTHLTGLFTDLGIEVAQLFFYRQKEQSKRLISVIRLRSAIIGFFFLGCIAGGYGYYLLGMRILLFGVLFLAIGIVYDSVKLRAISIKRKYFK